MILFDSKCEADHVVTAQYWDRKKNFFFGFLETGKNIQNCWVFWPALEVELMHKGPFINDVTLKWQFSDPLPPCVTLCHEKKIPIKMMAHIGWPPVVRIRMVYFSS